MKELFVVGIGPGDSRQMTGQAKEILEYCEVIVGYTVYVELVQPYFPKKEYVATGMTQEIARCRRALELANEGKKTAVVCSGDAGIYGMAGIILELAEEFPEIDIQVIPGVTAALSGAAVLGAPLGHDFAVISLSDLLTPWVRIEYRLRCAAKGDFAICIYNPSSRKRKDYLKHACEILLEYLQPETICGYVKNIGRNGQESSILTLEELKDTSVDMFTTVFIGNSRTRCIGAGMVTPRGYENKNS